MLGACRGAPLTTKKYCASHVTLITIVISQNLITNNSYTMPPFEIKKDRIDIHQVLQIHRKLSFLSYNIDFFHCMVQFNRK